MHLNHKEFIRRFLPRSIRPYRILSGFLRGRILYTSLHDYPAAILGHTEAEMVAWLVSNVKKGEFWIDIGAHYGYISLVLAVLTGLQGRVYAFEPMITTAGYLNKTRKANRLDQLVILPLALGAADNPILLQLPTSRGMADATIKMASDFEYLIQVSLDSLWKSLAGAQEKVSGIKIDVQGMELEVLTGMKALLQKDMPALLLEFHTGVDRSRVLSLLESCGYRLPGRILPACQPVNNLGYQDNQSYLFLPAKHS